jgi:hypothetical protein
MIFLKFFLKKDLQKRNNALYLHSRLSYNGSSQNENKIWGISSVGSERLPYKQDVGGSNPSFPTKKKKAFSGSWMLFCFPSILTLTPDSYRDTISGLFSLSERELRVREECGIVVRS